MKAPSLRDLVDADLPFSESELTEISRAAQKGLHVDRKEMAIGLSIIFAPAFFMFGLGAYFIPALMNRQVGFTILSILMCGWICISMTFIQRRSWHVRAFRRELNRRGYRICVSCGYWLKGLKSNAQTCPECGAAAENRRRDVAAPRSNSER